MAADEAESDVRRANDAIIREEPLHGWMPGELLVKPTEGSLLRWCFMGPPDLPAELQDVSSIDIDAPLSEFWVSEIFDAKSDCHDRLRKFHREFVHEIGKRMPFRWFCAACANKADDDPD